MLTFNVNDRHERLLAEFARLRIVRGFNRGKGDGAPVMCREYLQFLEMQECEDITSSTVSHYRKFCDHLKSRRKYRGRGLLGHAQQQHIRYSVHSFYEFLLEADYMDSIPVTGSLFHHPEKREKDVLLKKHIDLLFANANTLQEKVILALAYGCGMRRSEIERLQISDYRPNACLIAVREGKYFKSRIIPVSMKMNEILGKYLNEFRLKVGHPKEQKFLVDPLGKPINGEEAYVLIRKLARRSGLKDKPVGLHILRNSIAVHMLDKGADFEFVKRFLGHALLDTTMLYSTKRRKRISLKRRINALTKSA